MSAIFRNITKTTATLHDQTIEPRSFDLEGIRAYVGTLWDCPDLVWDALSEGAQDWVTDAYQALKDNPETCPALPSDFDARKSRACLQKTEGMEPVVALEVPVVDAEEVSDEKPPKFGVPESEEAPLQELELEEASAPTQSEYNKIRKASAKDRPRSPGNNRSPGKINKVGPRQRPKKLEDIAAPNLIDDFGDIEPDPIQDLAMSMPEFSTEGESGKDLGLVSEPETGEDLSIPLDEKEAPEAPEITKIVEGAEKLSGALKRKSRRGRPEPQRSDNVTMSRRATRSSSHVAMFLRELLEHKEFDRSLAESIPKAFAARGVPMKKQPTAYYAALQLLDVLHTVGIYSHPGARPLIG